MNYRGARPVPDKNIQEFITNQNLSGSIYDENVHDACITRFLDWLNESKSNTISGLSTFSNINVCAGTIQAFDHFYWRHKNKRFRIFPGEFMYHNAVLKNGGHLVTVDADNLRTGDALILSVPFSDFGSVRTETHDCLAECDRKNIPVLLDFAYLPASKNVFIDLDDFNSIETIAFSLSKAFYGAEFLRIGFRMERTNFDDGIDVFNSVDMVNRYSLAIANTYMDNFSIDYPWQTYEQAYKEVCNELNLRETNCIMFGLGDDKWSEYNRGTTVNRVCISDLIGEIINDTN